MARIKFLLASLIVVTLGLLCGCGNGYSEDALHINYSPEENYGTEEYLGTTLIIGGSGMDEEKAYTVKELEEMATEDENLQYQGEYSMMSRGGEFSLHKFTGIRLPELLKESGLKENLSEDTEVRFVSVDGYALVMELGEVMESTDGTYESRSAQEPMEENVPKIIAFGSDDVPLTGTVGAMKLGEDVSAEEGYVEEAENVGGPIRLVSGQKSGDEFNAPDNAKWLRQIIIGEDDNPQAHSKALEDEQALRANKEVKVDPTKGQWNHSSKPYNQYLTSILTVIDQEGEKTRITLEELENMESSTVTEAFGASCGVNGYRGVILRDIIEKVISQGAERPGKITVRGEDGYETQVDVKDVYEGIDSRYQLGEHRDIIIAYAIDGTPLVEGKSSQGFKGENGFGPMRLVVENQVTRWVKNVTEIQLED